MIQSTRLAAVGLILMAALGAAAMLPVVGWLLWPHVEEVKEAAPERKQPENARAGGAPIALARLMNIIGVGGLIEGANPAREDEIALPAPDEQKLPLKRARPEGESHPKPADLLNLMIMMLHDEAVTHFIATKGFGFGRMGPTVSLVKREWQTPWWSLDESDLDLQKKKPGWSSDSLTKGQPPRLHKDLGVIHTDSVNWFTTPGGFGFMGGAARMQTRWEIKSLDLVGLVMHDSPVVYLSEGIPEMKDLGETPTRPLDYFELFGLQHLLKGDRLYVRGKEGTIRVLGPIHAGESCLKCHRESKEGDLLGAFSYTLRQGRYELVGIPGGVSPKNPSR